MLLGVKKWQDAIAFSVWLGRLSASSGPGDLWRTYTRASANFPRTWLAYPHDLAANRIPPLQLSFTGQPDRNLPIECSCHL